ncbi:filamentous hemagglutinin family outer membrane protein [[Leptolyngbya] sp. PCC 7376]|nr:filamentous hemagglutinin family outer membrane protein [[Leptolyngbya] sp. PCC 7376]
MVVLETQATAQIVAADGTVGTVVSGISSLDITGGTQQSTALFHSFSEFSPGFADVTFNLNMSQNLVDIVIGRVTGNNPSFIDSNLILTGGNNPDLYLLNPNGITFGPSASLSLPGSFIATTADSLVFRNNLEFSAATANPAPLLTISTPMGLQLGTNPGEIFIDDGVLEIGSGQTIGFVGGTVTLDAGVLEASEGRVELFAAANAFVPLTMANNQQALGTQPTVGEWRDITLQNDSDIFNRGNGGGAVQIQGRNITLKEQSSIRVINDGAIAADDISIYGSEQVLLTDENTSGSESLIFSEVDDDATAGGEGADINIFTERLLVRDGASIFSQTESVGTGGSINIDADYVEVSGQGVADGFSSIRSEVDDEVGATGRGGDVIINTQTFLADGAVLGAESEGPGDAGDFRLTATGDVILRGVQADGLGTILTLETEESGAGGNLFLQADRLFLMDGALIDVDTENTGQGGNIQIGASLVSLSGINDRGFGSAITTEVDPDALAIAQGGDIFIDAERLELRDGSVINSSARAAGTAGNVLINAQTVELDGAIESLRGTASIKSGVIGNVAGTGGGITLNTNTLTLQNGAIIDAATEGSGNGGSIDVQAQTINISGQTLMGNRGGFTTAVRTGATGQAGQIRVQTNDLTLQGGDITASTAGGNNAGQIEITATGLVKVSETGTIQSQALPGSIGNGGDINLSAGELTLTDAKITANNLSSGGSAGDVAIAVPTRVTLERGQITALANDGDGSDLTVNAGEALLLRDNSLLSTATRNGNAGDINLTAPLIVGLPLENTDIVAQSLTGNDGRISITTQGLFGLRFRPQQTPKSDIVPGAELGGSLGFGVSGIVEINSSKGEQNIFWIALLNRLKAPDKEISYTCDNSKGNTFTITGRGGLPPSPVGTLIQNRHFWIDMRTVSFENNGDAKIPSLSSDQPVTQPLTATNGWHRTNASDIELISTAAKPPILTSNATCSGFASISR